MHAVHPSRLGFAVTMLLAGCIASFDPDPGPEPGSQPRSSGDDTAELDARFVLATVAPDHDGTLRRALEALVAAGPPGALAFQRSGRVSQWTHAGVADVCSRSAPALRDRWRIASVTKPFVATVVLQLVAEEVLALDHRVDDYLPGVLPHELPITVRQLLQHTSGLADYHDFDQLDDAAAYQQRRFADPPALDRIALALAHSPVSAPGAVFHYTDTNYRVLELLVEARTGHSIGAEISRRIIGPLRLADTSFPIHDPRLAGPHLHGYMPADLSGEPFGDQDHLIDYTTQTLDQTGGAGAMISSAPDLARFYDALMSGVLIPPTLLVEMLQTVPVDDDSAALGITGYGLGLERWDLGCGTWFGHGGSTRGYTTLSFTRPGGHDTAVLVATQDPLLITAYGPALQAAATAICSGR